MEAQTTQSAFSGVGRIGSDSSAFRLEEMTEKSGLGAGREKTKLWLLTFDLPGEKVNKLNAAVMASAAQIISELETKGKEGRIDLLVLASGKRGNFIAGADIEMLQAATDPEKMSREGQELFSRWEDLPFPTVAAIDG